MSAQAGKNIFIEDGTGTAAAPIAALRTTTVTMGGEAVDVSTRDSNGWRELLAGAGMANVTIKGDGVVLSGTTADTLRGRVLAQSIDPYTAAFANGSKLAGGFQLTQFELKGDYNKEQLYSFTLESSGSMTPTAGT